jgi:anaerobic ribonucleoside-triphosphate reductase
MSVQYCEHCGKEKVPCCPTCGKPVEVYSRIVGYMRPVSHWNAGKVEEFRRRKEFILNHGDHVEERA